MEIKKGDTIIFDRVDAGFQKIRNGRGETVRRAVAWVNGFGQIFCNINGIHQAVPYRSIRRVLPVREWRAIN